MSTTLKITKGDVVINGANGRPSTVVDDVKLRQDLSEFFSVEVQPSGFGAGVEQLIGVVELSPDMFTSLADRQIRDGIGILRSLQQNDPRIPRPASELVVGLTYLKVEQDPSDPTKYFFRANIISEQGLLTPILKPITI